MLLKMSKILRNLLKGVIFPASLLIILKAVGIYLATILYNLQIFIETRASGPFFSIKFFFLEKEETLLANSFSNILIYTTFSIITTYILIKYSLLVISGRNPKMLIKLHNVNLLKWVSHKSNTFIRVLIWIFFTWIIQILITIDAFQGQTYSWLPPINFLVAIILSWIAIRIFETKMENLSENKNLDIM